MKNDALVVVGRLSYPNGTAGSNRVHLYCKALKLEKGFPFIINLHSIFKSAQKFNYIARHEGIPFYYAQKTPLYEGSIFKRNFKKIIGLINTIIIIKRLKKQNKLKVLFFSTALIDEFILYLFLRFEKIKIIRELNEAPLFIQKGGGKTKYNLGLLRIRSKMYNDVIVISDFLNNFYTTAIRHKNIFQIPILVDMDRFNCICPSVIKNENKLITYVGFMGGNKDGLEDLIEAIALLETKYKNIHLDLIGSAKKKDILRLLEKVEKMGLDKTVSFLGPKNVDEIPSFLLNSNLLVLARPDNNQAKAGFPTKLGEYLASGIPVVITQTGEITKYLINRESAYLAEPSNIENFAENLFFALNDKNAYDVGLKGKEIANRNFNYKLFGKKIIEIIRNQ